MMHHKILSPQIDGLGQSFPPEVTACLSCTFQKRKEAGAYQEKLCIGSISSETAFPWKGKKLSADNQALCFVSTRWLDVVKAGLVRLTHKDEGGSWAFLFLCIIGQDSWGSNTLRIMKHLLISSPDGEQGIFFFLNVWLVGIV